jgi:hypothetical protein
MKKLILLFALVGGISYANAQIGSGSLMIGGGLNFNTSSSETTNGGTTVDGPTTTSFGISPRVGYFFTDNLAVGLELGYNSTSTKITPATPPPDEIKSTTSTFEVSPFIRYYSPIADKGGAFLQATVSFATGTDKDETTTGGTTVTTESDISSFGVGINPGIYWFITEKIGLEGTFGFLGYTSETIKTGDEEEKSSDFGLVLDTRTIGVGFHYYIGR